MAEAALWSQWQHEHGCSKHDDDEACNAKDQAGRVPAAASPCSQQLLARIPRHIQHYVFAAYCAWVCEPSSTAGTQFESLLEVRAKGCASARGVSVRSAEGRGPIRALATSDLATPVDDAPLHSTPHRTQVCPWLDLAVYRHAAHALPHLAASARQWRDTVALGIREQAAGEKLVAALQAALPCPARRVLKF